MHSLETEEELARVRSFINSHVWHFAKSLPEIPHWYCLLKDKYDVEEFRWFAAYIREHSITGQFYGKTYYNYYLDGFKYWWMDTSVEECDLINRDVIDGEMPIVFPRYSMIVTGSLERVLELFRQHNVPLRPDDFFPGKGYVFMVRLGSDNGQALVEALHKSSDVMALSSMYGQGFKQYVEFCKESIIPVEIGFDL